MTTYSLETLVAHARQHSPFYRAAYAGLPEHPALTDLPILDLDAYWHANTLDDNQVLTGPMEDGIVFKSGGTTGQPKFSCFTRDEWEAFVHWFGQHLRQPTLRAGDRVANLFYSGELYASFLFVTGSLQHASLPLVHLPLSGGASTEVVLHTLHALHATVIAGVPSSLLALAEQAVAQGLVFPEIHTLIFGGESLFEGQRATLHAAFPNAVTNSMGYASVDAGLLGWVDGSCGPDEHRCYDGATLLEIVDDVTGAPITEPGIAGRVLITNLTRRLMPILRYPAGDRACWSEPADAPNRRFRLLGRAEEGARVGPMTLYTEDLRAVLAEFTAAPLATFQVRIENTDGRDRLHLHVVPPENHTPDAALADALAAHLRTARPMFDELLGKQLIHPIVVHWTPMGELLRNPRTGKLRHVIDTRF